MTDSRQNSICAVIPAYNTSDTIEAVIQGTLKYLPTVIVADDGSTDGTAETARKTGAQVITIYPNSGKGNALKILFQEAIRLGFSAAVCLDADGQHDPDDIPRFLESHRAHPEDLIIGSRMHDKSRIPRARYNSMHIARFYVSLCANQYVEDTQCGFRLYPLAMIKQMELTTERYVTETEIIVKAGDSGRNIRHVIVKTIYKNNVSHFRPLLDIDAIVAYLSSFLWIKWLKESVSPDRPFTYEKGNIRDRIAAGKFWDGRFQVFTMGSFFPATVLFYLMYILLRPFLGNTFASVRRINCSFFKILLATELLPVLLLITALDPLMSKFNINILDGFIQTFYPDIWGGASY